MPPLEMYPALKVALKLSQKFRTQDREGIDIFNFQQEVISQKKQK